MRSYRYGDLELSSGIALPELLPGQNHQIQWTIKRGPAKRIRKDELQWFGKWLLPDRKIWLSFARYQQGYLLRFPGKVDFEMSIQEQSIICRPRTDLPPSTFRHLLLDQVFPLALSLSGRLVLHAAAVQAPEGVIAFLGKSGQGKSTLAAAFAQQGFPIVTDDCLMVTKKIRGELVVIPSYPGLRLWSDSISSLFRRAPSTSRVSHYNQKRRVAASATAFPFSGQQAKLARIYVLDPQATKPARPEAEPRISHCSGRSGLLELMSHTFHMDTIDNKVLNDNFGMMTGLTAERLVRRLSFTQAYGSLHRVIDAVRADLRA